MGHYQKSEILNKSKKGDTASETFSSSGKATKKEIAKMTESQKTKYIITGDK
jgi:hypothetical protein